MRRTNHRFANYQSLETRRLLAGDVTVSVVGSVLNIVGDSLGNEIEVFQNENGATVVTGIDTTVNGVSSFVVGDSYRFMSLFMREGDDSVALSDLVVNQNISFFGDEGNDRFTSTDTFAFHLHAEGGAGDDVFDLSMRIRKSAYLFLGDGDDTVALGTFSAGRNFKIFAGAGNDTIASDNLIAGRRLEIDLEEGNDNLLFAGNTSAGFTSVIDGVDGTDFIAFAPSEGETVDFSEELTVDAGLGGDTVFVGEQVFLDRSSEFSGGEGIDSISFNNSSVDVADFENDQIADLQSELDSVFAALAAAGIDASNFGGESQQEPLLIAASTGAVTFTEGDAPVIVDDGLTITGQSGAVLNGATVTIDGFANEDVLEFEDLPQITGVFDDQTGVLTLSGDDTIENYQSALRGITFSNSSPSPVSDPRTIQFSITSDQETVSASRELQIVAVNTAPTIEFAIAQRDVPLSELPVTLDSALELTDADDVQLSQAIVQIATGFTSDDVLEFDFEAGINATFDASTGTITASGDADVADYQSFLRSIRFASSSPSIGSRTIRFSIGDGVNTASADFSLQLTDG